MTSNADEWMGWCVFELQKKGFVPIGFSDEPDFSIGAAAAMTAKYGNTYLVNLVRVTLCDEPKADSKRKNKRLHRAKRR